MSKDSSSIPSFFWHYLAGIAIYQGWDMESEMLDSLEDIKSHVQLVNKNEFNSVTIGDLIEVSKGNYTQSFKDFCKNAYDYALENNLELKDSDTVMISMHSGSSDYFTWAMLKDFVESL